MFQVCCAYRSDRDAGEYDVPADGDEFRPLHGHLSPDEQSAFINAVAETSNDRRSLVHGVRLCFSTTPHLQTGVSPLSIDLWSNRNVVSTF